MTVVTVDYMTLDAALDGALKAIEFPADHPLHRYGHWRLEIHGPWHLRDGTHWQAIAHPYNATGQGLDRQIEGLGATPTDALLALVIELEEVATP